MSYATTYATPEVLEATWEAVSPGATGGAIEIRPYPTAAPSAGGGFAMPAPPPDPFDGFDDYGGKRYLDASGNPQWMPTPDEIARDRRAGLPIAGIDYDRLDGMDGSYAGRPPRPVAPSPARSVGRAARGTVGDAIGGVGGAVGLGVGGILDGGIAGYAEYQSGGGVASAVAVGVGAGVGSAVGTVVGGIAGSALGPVGTVVGGMIGGAIGSALGGAIGDALIPDANLNGAQTATGPIPFSGGQMMGVRYVVSYTAFQHYPWGGGRAYNYVDTNVFMSNFGQEQALGPLGAPTRVLNGTILNYGISTGGGIRYLNLGGNITRDISGGWNWSVTNFSVRRADGLADTGGDPQGELEPYNPNARDRPATGTPDFRLPGVDLPRPRPIFGNPRLRDPNPFGEPSPEPTPDPTDDPYPYPYPWPRPTPTPGPTPDPAPYPDPTDDPNPNPNPDDDDQENCNPCAKLDEILEKLESQEEPMLLTPEWWAYRAGSERPQLLVVYALKNADGSWSRTRFQFNIPWFDNRKRRVLKSILPKKIQKGRHQGTLTLTDNSKMIQFCRNQSESERVLKAFEKLVIPRYKTGDIRFADTNGNAKRKFREITVELMEARFYAQGQREESPSWKEKFY